MNPFIITHPKYYALVKPHLEGEEQGEEQGDLTIYIVDYETMTYYSGTFTQNSMVSATSLYDMIWKASLQQEHHTLNMFFANFYISVDFESNQLRISQRIILKIINDEKSNIFNPYLFQLFINRYKTYQLEQKVKEQEKLIQQLQQQLMQLQAPVSNLSTHVPSPKIQEAPEEATKPFVDVIRPVCKLVLESFCQDRKINCREPCKISHVKLECHPIYGPLQSVCHCI
jgi:cell division protein FtsB